MKPTSPLRNKFSVSATTSCRGLSLSRWMRPTTLFVAIIAFLAALAAVNATPCTVTSPMCGIIVVVPPTDFIIEVSDPVDPVTVQASDLMVNGTPANADAIINGNTTSTPHPWCRAKTRCIFLLALLTAAMGVCKNSPARSLTSHYASPTPTQPPPSPTATATPTATPTLTPRLSPTPRFAPTPRPRPTPAPRP